MRDKGRNVLQLPLPENCAQGTFVPPTLIELDNIGELKREGSARCSTWCVIAVRTLINSSTKFARPVMAWRSASRVSMKPSRM
ncbi:MAG: Transcriptional repressor of PutA and PutP / Proline dehydrogenase (EC / Delta-1-pyrroline-5-carboxylate dehydrogenase (EC [uncultured Caballeronia sp.]|nr:MAG: Transcriptional repressor of PutA and PutP / Proline dehydrogenase (EC / Delta-1-pyrroline-5-carboxylate dehydrogenase (EC [uncultured Caballeronia sp.]